MFWGKTVLTDIILDDLVKEKGPSAPIFALGGSSIDAEIRNKKLSADFFFSSSPNYFGAVMGNKTHFQDNILTVQSLSHCE